MAEAEPEEPPMHEADSREDPAHRPQVPTEDDESRELHSSAGGGRDQVATGHHVEHTIADPQETVSNEGIIESVRKLFGMHNRGKTFVALDGNASANIAKIYKTIEGTFASKEWLDKQTPVKEDVKVDDLLKNLDPKNLVASVQETFAISQAFSEAVNKAQLGVLETLGPVLRLWHPQKLTDKVYEATMEVVASVSSVNELAKKPTRTRTNLLPCKGEPTAPPLSIEAILELATTINKCMKTDVSSIENQNDLLDKQMGAFSEAYYQISRQDAHSESYNPEAWAKLASRVFDKLSPNGVQEALAASRQFGDTCVACVVYMERSIKGGKPTVSNEGIFDVIKSIFGSKPKDLDIDYIGTGIEKEFARTLFDQKWLEGQKFTEGKVSFKFPKAGASGDYQQLCKQVEAELNATAEKNANVVKAYYAKTLPAFAAMNESIINRKIEDIQKLRDLVVYEDMDFNIKWLEPKNITEPDADVTFPALDAAGVKKAAETILHLLEILTTYQNKCLENVPDAPKIKWRDLVSQIKDDTKRPLIQEYYEDLESINDYGIECFFQRNDNYWYMVENLTAGLMRWIAKSVTGVNYS